MDELSCHAVIKYARRGEKKKNWFKNVFGKYDFFSLMCGLGAAELGPFNNCFLIIYCL